MSARVYLASGRWVDVPGMSVEEILEAFSRGSWTGFTAVGGEYPTAAFRTTAVEAVVAA